MSRPGAFPALIAAGLLVLLPGCSSLLGGPATPVAMYQPSVTVTPDPAWPEVSWSLVLVQPQAPSVLDDRRLLVHTAQDELLPYRGVTWALPPPALLTQTVLQTLDASGRIGAVAHQDSGMAADYRLLLELSRFQAEQDGAPAVQIDVTARLLRMRDMRLVGSRHFALRQPAASMDAPALVNAFGQALGKLGHDIAGWALATGQAATHEP